MALEASATGHTHNAIVHSTLAGWAREHGRSRSTTMMPAPAGLRFAFYGRVSTEDRQDPATSRAWQLLRAQAVTSGYGRVVAEFFDVGHSRVLSWSRRPEAAALLAAMADPNRDFDAIVIGSCERAFYGNQFATMAPLFEHYGVALWVPELGGAVDPALVGHEELMILLGVLSKREIARARLRVRSAMTVQARDQGRYLGGRPPYGYRLADAGPHANRSFARRGVRIQRLAIDPECGRIVRWIFAQRLARHSVARITRALHDAGIPCPSSADPERNPHVFGDQWALTSVRAILRKPRYTGRQVWNRQRTDHELLDPDNTSLGHRDMMRWNAPEDWVISTKPAHPALDSEADFVAAQHIRAVRTTAPGHAYLLAGLLRCGVCDRRMESCWARRAAYRCRHGHTSATRTAAGRPPNVYVREDHILPHLPALLIRLTTADSNERLPEPGHGEPPSEADAVRHLRAKTVTLTFDPASRTLAAETSQAERITIG